MKDNLEQREPAEINMLIEQRLWAESVEAICMRRKIAIPSQEEWIVLKKQWRYGQSNSVAVDLLQQMRDN